MYKNVCSHPCLLFPFTRIVVAAASHAMLDIWDRMEAKNILEGSSLPPLPLLSSQKMIAAVVRAVLMHSLISSIDPYSFYCAIVVSLCVRVCTQSRRQGRA